jgi:hypothetical protein
MRYLPQTTTGNSKRFNPGVRPPLEKLPKELADGIRERDRIVAQQSAAHVRVNELRTDQMTQAAQQADDDAANKAARAGKTIPAPAAMPKLEADRTSAARALDAQNATLRDVTSELESLMSDIYWADAETAAADVADVSATIAAEASKLADKVEAAVDAMAVRDWMRHATYDRTAKTWPSDVVDLARYGLDRKNTTPINVRDAIIAAAVATLEQPTD